MAKIFIKCVDDGDKAWLQKWCKLKNITMSAKIKLMIKSLKWTEEHNQGEKYGG